jgi:hypothetical protein
MAHSHSSHSSGPQSGSDVHADGMNLKKIMLVGAAALAVFAVGIIWSYFLLGSQLKEIRDRGLATPASEIGKPEIGIVDQVLFSTDTRLAAWKADHAKRLGKYGWVDRAKGVAHIPIEMAMQKVIAAPPDIAGEGVTPGAAAPSLPSIEAAGAGSGNRVTPKKGTHIGTKVDDESHKAGGQQ